MFGCFVTWPALSPWHKQFLISSPAKMRCHSGPTFYKVGYQRPWWHYDRALPRTSSDRTPFLKKLEQMKEVKDGLFLFMGSGALAIWHTGTNPGGTLDWQAAGAGAQSKKKKKIHKVFTGCDWPSCRVFFCFLTARAAPLISFKVWVRVCGDWWGSVAHHELDKHALTSCAPL